jgi:2-polyprenyl-3-methyl-5-hydroxy-6-metoxy-1,4-benzoquinol methylase
MDLKKQMEQIYRDMPLDKIPWDLTNPPRILQEAVGNGKIKPCRAVDLGCGTGRYAVWLAQNGFEVTGIDFSKHAVKLAEKLADDKGVSCRFVVADLFDDLSEFNGVFDFAYDWEVMHHIFPDDRPGYIRNVYDILRPKSMYLSVGFSENDPAFGGSGKYRQTRLGTTLYFSSNKELEQLFDPFFNILELKTVEIPGKYGPHMANMAWLERK